MSNLTEEEKRFVEYWRLNRDKQKKLFRQLLIGLPVGLLFAIPIILNFSAGWDKRASMWARGHADDSTGSVLIVAVLIIAVFVAIFSKRHKWEMYEQQYRELLNKKDDSKEPPAVDNTVS
jgi:sterol desaturase/sphingolipid hydroxylase (fatty acid hydroxylase superfamily)